MKSARCTFTHPLPPLGPRGSSRQGRGNIFGCVWHIACYFLLLQLLLPSPSLAEGISGYVEAKGFAYRERTRSRDPWALGWGTIFSKWEQKVAATQLTASLRGEWISSDEQGPLTFDPADRRLRRSPLAIADLWLRLPLAPALDLQLGRFQLGWGKTDGYSPADAFLPRDLSDPFSDEKIPLWAVRLNGERGPFRFEAVVAPLTTPWRLPLLGSRNAPLRSEGIPPGTVFREIETTPPDPGFAALRTLYTIGEWDLGAWGRVGVRPAPLLAFRIDQAAPAASGMVIPIERRYAREQALGVELSRVTGPWILRGEAATLFSRDAELGNAVIGSLSAERGFGDNTLLITLAGNALKTPVDQSLLFDRALLPAIIVAWNRTEQWGEWKLVWNGGLKHGDGLVKGEAGYNLTDLWKVTVGAEIPYGTTQGPFGALNTAQRLHLALRRSW